MEGVERGALNNESVPLYQPKSGRRKHYVLPEFVGPLFSEAV